MSFLEIDLNWENNYPCIQTKSMMLCAWWTQILWISYNTKLLIVEKGLYFCRDLVSVPTAQAIRSKKIVIISIGSSYPFEKEMLSVRITQAICSINIAICSNSSGKKIVICWKDLSFSRVTIKISSCRVNKASRQEIKQLGISFGFIFFSYFWYKFGKVSRSKFMNGLKS